MDPHQCVDDDQREAEVPVTMEEPQDIRKIPREVEFIAPLRRSQTLDSNQAGVSDMYPMCIQVPLIGHGSVINKNLHVCEALYGSISVYEMINMSAIMPLTSFRWIVGDNPHDIRPTTVMSGDMRRAASCYSRRGPLFAYSNVAVLEATNHTSDNSFWTQYYQRLDTITRHYGWRGTVFDCSILSMGPSVGDDDDANLDARIPADVQDGILDVCYTPQTKGGGRIRALAFGTQQRIETSRTREMAEEIISAIVDKRGQMNMAVVNGDWVLRWYGFTCRVTIDSVYAMVRKWRTMCEPNMPVLHIFEELKVITMSTATGVLIRPMRTSAKKGVFEFQGPYVDSMAIYHSDTLRFAKMQFPSRSDEPEQYCCFLLLTEPFFRWSTEPRENLGIQMGTQGLGLHPVKGDATIMSLGESSPIVVTSYMNALLNTSSDECRITTPGKNAVMAFINRTCNTEDAVSIMMEWATSGAFAWHSFISFPLPKDSGVIRPGMILKNQNWWVPATEGVVISVTTSKSGDQIANVYMIVKELKIGDKIMMGHGIKFTVGELIPYKDMPRIVDDTTGEIVVPNVLINAKNLTRGIGGWMREMSACTSAYDSISHFRSMKAPTGRRVYTPAEELEVEPMIKTGAVEMYGKRLSFKNSDGTIRVIRCNYGIGRLTQIRHMAVFKQHFPRSSVMGNKVPRGKMRGGTPRLGETELL
ncbi:hypothetical protein F5Y03DRAFT_400881 [Xylaria venustula]|nr:hypothetical protein F5Y03DRAFT_400881 [Xylaria venustula]